MKTRSGRDASQRNDELAAFIALLKAEGARRYLEIGARHGDTFHAVMMALPKGSQGVALDLPGGKWGTDKSRAALLDAVEDVNANGRTAEVIFGNSRALGVIQAVALRGPYDAVLIDGDHTYEAVAEDYANYRTMARIVALHDIDGAGLTAKSGGHPVEVPRLWAEIRASDVRSREIIGMERGMGIGVVFR